MSVSDKAIDGRLSKFSLDNSRCNGGRTSIRRLFRGSALLIVTIMTTIVVCDNAIALCPECENINDFIADIRSRLNLRDPQVDAVLFDDRIIYGVQSLKRVSLYVSGRTVQAVRMQYGAPPDCKEETVPIAAVRHLRVVNVGGGGNPIYIRILPAGECVCTRAAIANTPIEFSVGVGYTGRDNSERKIGPDNTYYTAQLLLGRRITEDVTVAVGVEGMYESDRLRVAVLGHLRFAFLGTSGVVETVSDLDSCQFVGLSGSTGSCPCDTSVAYCTPPGSNGIEYDPTVCLRRDFVRVESRFRPFVFLEGGVVFDAYFPSPDYSGPSPSLNPDEYRQFLIGGGLGLPLKHLWLWDPLVIRLGYRYSRLNLRTPCEACGDRFLVNTNRMHSILLNVGLHFDL